MLPYAKLRSFEIRNTQYDSLKTRNCDDRKERGMRKLEVSGEAWKGRHLRTISGPPLLRIATINMPLPPSPLPSPQDFLDSLLGTLNEQADTALDAASKPTLLTLHAIFPSLLLPALDLLDRRLLTRFVLKEKPDAHNAEETGGEKGEERIAQGNGSKEAVNGPRQRVVYYVRSNASSHSDRRSRYVKTADIGSTHYEVRPWAWSCTCAAFAFSAYNVPSSFSPSYASYEDLNDYDRGQGYGHGVTNEEDEEMLDMPEGYAEADRRRYKQGKYGWGGLMLGEREGEVPLCKHLLACALAERWRVAAEMIEERMVGSEEMAGWGAGWGG